jgi:hypothetical protein
MKSKKALFFSPGIVIIVLFIMLEAYVIFNAKDEIFKADPLGKRQQDLIDTYAEAQKHLFYIDQSARHSTYQLIYDLAKNGGCNGKEGYFGYTLWDVEEKQDQALCLPTIENVRQNVVSSFSEPLNRYLSAYDSFSIPQDNYNFNFKDTDLLGLAIVPLTIEIPGKYEQLDPIGTYSIKPSFRVNLNYDFSDYETLRNKANQLTEQCQGKNFEICVNTNQNRIFDDENFELTQCESEQKEDLYRLADYFDRCVNSKDKSCICTQNNPSIEGSFEITQEGNGVMISNKDLEQKIENTKLVDNYVYLGGASYFHKDHEGKIIVQSYFDADQCTPEPKTKFRFCVKSKNNKFVAYDDGKADLWNVIYKFALDFGEQTEQEIITTPATQGLLDEMTYIIAASCQEEKEKTIEAAHNLALFLSQKTQGIVIDTSSSKTCFESRGDDYYKQYLNPSGNNIFIVLETDISGDGIVEHNGNDESINLAEALIGSLKETVKFQSNPTNSEDPKLKTADKTAKIIFSPETIDEDTNPQYIFEALKQNIDIPFSYQEIENPGEIPRGLVSLKWVWETAKEENINYNLLLAVIGVESNFQNINEPADKKAHGLGQQFEAAITDIEAKLKARYPELNTKTPKQVYEDTLTSKTDQSLRIQITATALYLHRTREFLESQGKPTNTRTIIQAYHDGVGKINKDGSSQRIDNKEKEAIDYYPKFAELYEKYTAQTA